MHIRPISVPSQLHNENKTKKDKIIHSIELVDFAQSTFDQDVPQGSMQGYYFPINYITVLQFPVEFD